MSLREAIKILEDLFEQKVEEAKVIELSNRAVEQGIEISRAITILRLAALRSGEILDEKECLELKVY